MFSKGKKTKLMVFIGENIDDIYYLKRILEKQNEILNRLKSIDNNIVKYFEEEHKPKERELNKKIRNAYTKNKHSKKEDICGITYLPCCYCQPVCGSRKAE